MFSVPSKKVYIYDATGVKQRKTVSTGATTDYAGNYVYENNTLQFFNQPEGYVEPTSDVNKPFQYVYQYKDHLGNIRLSYKDVSLTSTPSLQIVEENNYYPFGLKHKGYNNVQNGRDHKYKYNGKELQEELGLNMYDYGFRNYDPALGRWMNVDPLAEQGRRWSPYNYCYNNPLKFVDPDGMWPTPIMVDNGKFRSSFGKRFHPITKEMKIHKGADISAPVGNNVRAAADGVVTKVSYQFNEKSGTGWGYYVEVTHSNGFVSRYAHLKKDGVKVKVGDKVNNGNVIALSGASGGVTGPHLHFEILENGVQIDPMIVMDLQKLIDFMNKEIQIEPVIVKTNKKANTEEEPDKVDDKSSETKPEETKPEETKPDEKKDEKK